MRNKRKLLSLIGMTTLVLCILVGCNKSDNVNIQENESNKEYISENNLSNYNEEGQLILKENYTEDKLDLALNNIGNSLSNITLKNLEGEEVNLNQFSGKKIVFEISQDTCSYCKENIPITHHILSKNDDIILVPIFLNSTVEGIKSFYDELGVEIPKNIWIDENKETVKEFSLSKTPTIIFVDETGKISLIKQEVYTKESFSKDLNLAFGDNKIYEMKNNSNK